MSCFVLIVLGQIISLFGNAALRFALPLVLLRQSGSAALYGTVTALAMFPALAGMLVGGALADRCRKARLMAGLDLGTAVLCAGAALAVHTAPAVPFTLLVLACLYAIQGLYQPAVRASLPLVLPDSQLERGNAVIQLVDTVDELLGPLLGGVLLARCGLRGLLGLCALCFFGSAMLELHIRLPEDQPVRTTLSLRGIGSDLQESFRFLARQPAVLQLTATMAAVNLLEIPAITLGVPVLVVQYLHRSDAALGLAQAVLSAGGLAGGLLAGTVFSRRPLRSGTPLLLFIGGACAALGSVLLLPTFAYSGILVLGFAVMAAAMVFNVWFFAKLQREIPQTQLGRATACTTVLACLTQPIGQAAYGGLFEHFSACPARVLLGAGVVSFLVLLLLHRRST